VIDLTQVIAMLAILRRTALSALFADASFTAFANRQKDIRG
jgi:hypothetical protein